MRLVNLNINPLKTDTANKKYMECRKARHIKKRALISYHPS